MIEECEYKILLEKVADLLESRINLKQEHGPKMSGICKICDFDNINIDYILAGLKDKVKELRQAYRNYPIQVNYEDRYIRAAYMLSYFPDYIQPIYHVLQKKNIFVNSEKLNVGFLGGGALPEFVGLSKFIASNRKNIKEINVTVFDVTLHWATERERITKPLVQNYYKKGYKINSIKTNLWDKSFTVHESVKRLDTIVLQNTINEVATKGEKIFKNNLIKIWDKLPKDAIFIIIDLKYREIHNFIKDFTQSINNKKILQKLRKEPINNSLPKCTFIQEKLFNIKEKDLLPRRRTREYYNIILQKV